MRSIPINTRYLRQALPLLTLALAALGCEDPTALEATEPTAASSLSVYAMSGTPVGLPAAISVPAAQAVNMDGSLLFDVAFDIDAQGRAVLYPMELVAWIRVDVHRVGLFKSALAYDEVSRAPDGGYTYDETIIAEEGDVIVIESNDTRACVFPFPGRLYAKIVFDDIDPVMRVMRLRMTQNPNCGFRSFLPGVPED
jgi:hypothetical protein